MTNYFVSLNSSGILSVDNNIEIPLGGITSDHGTINFDDEHLTTTGNITGNNIELSAGGITSNHGTINFNDENLTTTGNITTTANITGNNIELSAGGITSASNTINFNDENLTTTGSITTTGNITGNNIELSAGGITSNNGTINFNDENLTTTGNVGIGNNNPNYTLDVTGNINFTGNITKDGDTLALWSSNSNGTWTNDNVAIGATAGSWKLWVQGDTNVTGQLYGQTLYTNNNIYSTNGALSLRSASDNDMYFYTNGSSRMHINSSGSIAIGTTANNSYKLYVNGASYLDGTVYRSGGYHTAMWKKSSTNAYWDEGSVGIGNSSPSYKLDVSGSIYGQGLYTNSTIYSTSGSLKLQSASGYYMHFVTNGSTRMTVDTSGFVGIGTTSPSYPLHIATTTLGESFSAARFASNGSVYGAISTHSDPISLKCAGQIWCTSYVWVSSDSRIKTNITDVPDNLALQQLRTIPCRYYEYIDKISSGFDKTIGFIAQEVKSILPMSVSEQTEIIPDVYKTINCSWTSVDDTIIMSSLDLPNVNGVKYRFYVSNAIDNTDEKMVEIIGNTDNTFTFETQYNNVFCYGKEVDDFNIIDKNKLFTLNFSATQEIDRIQQTHITEIEELKTEIVTLKQENIQQQTEIHTLKNELDNIKDLLIKNNIM